MKRVLYAAFASLLLGSCRQQTGNARAMQQEIDSLKAAVVKSYKPGFGEFMSGIQVHHAKLWFAGINKNWKLADFEMHEIGEALDDIRTYETTRKESQYLYILQPALDSINQAISAESEDRFRKSFIFLTNSCNNCHREVNYDFNQVKIPEAPPVSNQVFSPGKITQ